MKQNNLDDHANKKRGAGATSLSPHCLATGEYYNIPGFLCFFCYGTSVFSSIILGSRILHMTEGGVTWPML
ncbi:MAG: hypothetical protein WC073_06730 [Sterolibacterium sp.]